MCPVDCTSKFIIYSMSYFMYKIKCRIYEILLNLIYLFNYKSIRCVIFLNLDAMSTQYINFDILALLNMCLIN